MLAHASTCSDCFAFLSQPNRLAFMSPAFAEASRPILDARSALMASLEGQMAERRAQLDAGHEELPFSQTDDSEEDQQEQQWTNKVLRTLDESCCYVVPCMLCWHQPQRRRSIHEICALSVKSSSKPRCFHHLGVCLAARFPTPAAQPPSSGLARAIWPCARCSYLNASAATSCAVCALERVASKALCLSVQRSWIYA